MEVEKVVRMVEGEGENSYATNSQLQKSIIWKAKPFVEDTIIDLYCKIFPKRLTIVDLGCSSGPNTLFVVSYIIDAIDSIRQKLGHSSPEFQVILSDLPGNDFNTIFKSIPCFIEKLKKDKGANFGPCFIGGVPGSFYGRLFPTETINFMHSSSSAHYLSQVPPGIDNNKGNIYIANTSPQNVPKAYLTQYQMDFKNFLNLRSEELIPGGRMVITITGRRSSDPFSEESCYTIGLFAETLRDLVSQGLVEEEKLDSFNLPMYFPSGEEVKDAIKEQGSFHLDLLETFDVYLSAIGDHEKNDSAIDKIAIAQYIYKTNRAIVEPILTNHFGEEVIEDIFQKYAYHVAENLVLEKCKIVNLVMCMTKKG